MTASMQGAPQWFIARGPIWFDSTAAGSNNESGYVAENGASAAAFGFASQGHTITAGPTTTTPILITVNGITGYFPYNVLTTMPTGFYNAILSASGQGGQFTVT